MRTPGTALILAAIAGCSATDTLPPPTPTDEFVLACGQAASEWAKCEQRLEQACPQGHETLSEERREGRIELRVRCEGE